MAMAGLSALADSYGLERGVAQALQRRSERLFELLGEKLEPLAAGRVRWQGSRQAVESFADFCAASPSQHTLVFGIGTKTALSFRLDYALALGLVDGMLGRYDAPASASAAPLTATEKRILVNLVRNAVSAVAPEVFPEALEVFQDPAEVRLGARADLQITGIRDHAGLIPDSFEPGAPLVAMSAQYVINGRSGALAFGLSLAAAQRVSQAQTSQIPSSQIQVAQRLRPTLGAARLPLVAVLGVMTMPLTAVKALTPGSVISLGRMRGIAPQVELRAAGQTLCVGTVIAERGWYRFLMQPRRDSSVS